MTDMAWTGPLRISLGAYVVRGIIWVLGPHRSRRPLNRNIAATLNDEQRSDLGIENPPLEPISKFQGFELGLWVAKHCPDALQHELLRGIDR